MSADHFWVGVYTDPKKFCLLLERDSSFIVENICKECAFKLGIQFSYVPLFSLFHIAKKTWLSPNHVLSTTDLGNKVQYMFRIRFHPEPSFQDERFLNYLHLQYRHSFSKEFHTDGIESSVLFGNGVLDMIIDSYEKNWTKTSNVFQSKQWHRFFPAEILAQPNALQKFILKLRLKENTQKEHLKVRVHKIDRLKKTYLTEIQSIFNSEIFQEKFNYKNKNGDQKYVKIKKKENKYILCFETEEFHIKDIRFVKKCNSFVEIYFRGFSSKMLQMEEEEAESFVSGLDTVYRLAYNYYYGICDTIFSPRIKKLQELGSFDHIKEPIIPSLLLKSNLSDGFLLKMSINDIKTFEVFAFDPKTPQQIVKYVVSPNQEFPTLEKLQETHSFLNRKIIPSHFENCNLLISNPSDNKPLPDLDMKSNKNNQVYLESEIFWAETEPYQRGIFTESFRAKLKACKTPVSIKTLRDFEDSSQYIQFFIEGIGTMMKLSESNSFLQIKGILMNPTFGLITELPSTCAVDYLQNIDLPLTDILRMALTVSEGLEFLKSQNIVHGNICCEALQVTEMGVVKISDSSIVNNIYLLPRNNLIYKTRLPWIDPQLREKLISPRFESDIFSFGSLLCEMFCCNCKPPKLHSIPSQMKFQAPCRLLLNKSEFKGNSKLVEFLIEKIYELIKKCRCYKMENRPQAEEISKELDKLINESTSEEKFPLELPINSLCNHHWDNSIPINEVSDAIKLIPKKPQISKKSISEYEIDEKNLRMQHKIGGGCFGTVYLATYYSFFGEREVALKTFKEQVFSLIKFEFEILMKLKHERIVELIGICSGLGIVMEFVSGGSLLSKLEQTNSLIPNLDQILLETTEAMDYLESMKIIHRDLAARNILLTENDRVKITDFGLSKTLEKDYYRVKSEVHIPLHWSAPEIQDKITSKYDVWSFGVLMWECYSCGKHPMMDFPCKSLFEYVKLLKQNRRLSRPSKCPEARYAIMQQCWNLQPSKRPDFKNLQKVFLKNGEKKIILN